MILAESNNPCVQINEIVTTGKLSKLEHFENDEKVMDKVVHDCQYIYFLKEQERARPLLVMHKKIKKYAERKRQKHNYNKESSESLIQHQQHSLFSEASWGRLEMKPKRNKDHSSGTLIASFQALLANH